MRYAHTVDQVRAAENALMATLPAGTLMRRAAYGLAGACAQFLGRVYGARVAVVAGAGDNGGDALYAGAYLARRGARVDAIVLDDTQVHQAGLAELRRAGGWVATEAAAVLERADLVLDGIVGIGGRPGLRPSAREVWDLVEECQVPVVAVDIASGVDVDTGATPHRHVRATTTVAFGTHKVAHVVDPAADASGAVHLVDIGLAPYLGEPEVEVLQEADVAAAIPVPDRGSHKYTRGVVGVLAGSDQFPGAAALVVGGALGGSLGMVRYRGPEGPTSLVRTWWPEAVPGTGRVQAWVVGSGLGDAPERAEEVADVLDARLPVVVDADGLRQLPDRCDGPVLLTPHEGELARMLGLDRAEVTARRLEHARAAARRWNATVLLKGATTVVAAPNGRTRVTVLGTSWTATAGAGDVLSGICGALLAAGLDPLEAGSVGAYLHQAAAVLASDGGPVRASQIAVALPDALRAVLTA